MIAFSGCTSNQIEGKYWKNTYDYIELKTSGEYWIYQAHGESFGGNYEINGDQLFLLLPGTSIEAKIDGKTIIDPDGEIWTKN